MLDLDEVFRAYAGYVATIVLRILGQRDEVEDVVQDVFLSALGSLPRLRDPAALKGWLAAIAVRRASDRLRRRRLLLLLRLTRAAEPDPLPREASPEVKALCAHLYRCLEQVPSYGGPCSLSGESGMPALDTLCSRSMPTPDRFRLPTSSLTPWCRSIRSCTTEPTIFS